MSTPPQNILIVGAGVFGLSTALTFLDRPLYNKSQITIIDSAAILPNPVGSSVDASRIIRADYANPSYAKLACLAQESWRDQSPTGWGGEGRYTETGFVLTGDAGQEAYIRSSMLNVQDLARQGLPMQMEKIQELNDRESIRAASGLPGVNGDTGYANWNSGWADAEKGVAFAMHKIKTHPNNNSRITIRANCKVDLLLQSTTDGQYTGVRLTTGETISADLTILAAGAWTPSLFDLSQHCVATGQVIAYLQITPEEQTYLEKTPVVINFSRGTFVIPPQNNELKIARHGFGYRNPEPVHQSISSKQVSVPKTDSEIPLEADIALRAALKEFFPLTASTTPPTSSSTTSPIDNNTAYPVSLGTLASRPWSKTRVCWYTDTPTGNFLITYPPLPTSSSSSAPNTSLFLATGGSGHGYKFLPILGTYIVDAIERNLDPEFDALWKWEAHLNVGGEEKVTAAAVGCERDELSDEFIECKDGSRGGPKGLVLAEELERTVLFTAKL